MIAKKNTKRQKKGFTLIELLVVIVIIGILAALLLPAITSALGQGKGTDCTAHMKSFYQSLMIYFTQNKSLPLSEEGYKVWTYLGRTASNILQVSRTDGNDADGSEPIFQCPLGPADSNAKGDYVGPKSGWNVPPPTARNYLGGDKVENSAHGDNLNALRKDGGVIGVKSADFKDDGTGTAGTPGGDTIFE